jgi:hypothetical protein
VIEKASTGWNKWVRQIHRWLSIVFTTTVVANFVSMALGKPSDWIVYSPLPPLFLMLFTGLYISGATKMANIVLITCGDASLARHAAEHGPPSPGPTIGHVSGRSESRSSVVLLCLDKEGAL